jgi:hypothetical protein
MQTVQRSNSVQTVQRFTDVVVHVRVCTMYCVWPLYTYKGTSLVYIICQL